MVPMDQRDQRGQTGLWGRLVGKDQLGHEDHKEIVEQRAHRDWRDKLVLKVLKDVTGQTDLQGPKDPRGPRETLDLEDLQDPPVPTARKDPEATKENRERKEGLVRQAQRVPLVLLALEAHKDQRATPETRAHVAQVDHLVQVVQRDQLAIRAMMVALDPVVLLGTMVLRGPRETVDQQGSWDLEDLPDSLVALC